MKQSKLGLELPRTEELVLFVFVKVVKYLLNVLIQLREVVKFQLFDVFHLTILIDRA